MSTSRTHRLRTAAPAIVTTLLLIAGCARPSEAQPPRPTGATSAAPVTVLVVVDQLRADLLDRYDAVFTGGFRRLRDAGFRHTRATHDHALTLTAPGHATIATGTHPSRHGIVSNAWIQDDPRGRRMVENVVDPGTPILDAPSVPGASPGPLERTTLAQWLQDAHPEARILSVSGKSRAAVLMVGGADATVLWFEEAVGRFVTSGAWADAYPSWVTDFNADLLPGLQRDSVWSLELPARFRTLARRDTVAWEGDGVHTAFPHRFADERATWGDNRIGWWASTPALDRATRLLAQAGITGKGIGTDDVPDLVTISFSQTDRVGHAYGPRSLEQLDNLWRLDRELGAFMGWMDARFGPDGWRMVLTADHGVADTPEQAARDGRPGYRIPTDSALVLQTLINEVAQDVGTRPDRLARGLADAVPALSWIEQAWTFVELLEEGATEDSNPFTVFQARSTYPDRLTGVLGGQGIEMRFAEGTLLWSLPRGTTHGTPYLYDRHVPFVLYGVGVDAGVSDVPVSTVDIAPTLAAMMGIPTPDDLDGVARPGTGTAGGR